MGIDLSVVKLGPVTIETSGKSRYILETSIYLAGAIVVVRTGSWAMEKIRNWQQKE
jgi:hypothetical protein